MKTLKKKNEPKNQRNCQCTNNIIFIKLFFSQIYNFMLNKNNYSIYEVFNFIKFIFFYRKTEQNLENLRMQYKLIF